MNEQCIKLRDTFDTRFIKENKDLFYKISKENLNIEKGKNTMMRLLINDKEFKDDRANICEFVKGPCSLSKHKHYNDEINTTIYVFGERHTKEDICDNGSSSSLGIDDFLEELIKKTNVFLDIYLELYPDDEYYKSVEDDYKLHLLYKKFNKCINPKTRDNLEKCYLSRFHYGDIRNIVELGKLEDLPFIENMTMDQLDILISEDGEAYKLLKKISLMKTEEDVIKFAMDDFKIRITNKVLQKEISKCPYGVMIVKFCYSRLINLDLKRYIISLYTKMIKTCNTLLKQINYYKNNKSLDVLELIKYTLFEFNNIYISTISYIMDIYLLCRIFRNFKPSEDKPSFQSNIIIYAGQFHAEAYRDFFTAMNFKMEKHTENLKPFKNCVNVKDFLPLFE